MHAFDVLGDPVRRRILELLAAGETSAGEVAARVGGEFGISQPAVSQHLKVLRDNGFATVRAEGTRRLYAVDPSGLQEVDAWVEQFRVFWDQKLDALGTEIARGRKARRSSGDVARFSALQNPPHAPLTGAAYDDTRPGRVDPHRTAQVRRPGGRSVTDSDDRSAGT